jgi:transcriptional regulator with XRE-family HTH domain
MAIGPRVRERRKELGFTQEQLASQTGVTLSAVQRLEGGRITDPHYSTLEGIARALRTTVAELVGEEGLVLTSPKAEPPDTGVDHVRPVSDAVGVNDQVEAKIKERIERHLNAAIHDLEAYRRSKEAAELARVRDEVLAAL